MGFQVPQADLELATQSRIISNSRVSCMSLPNSGMERYEWYHVQATACVRMASLLCLQWAWTWQDVAAIISPCQQKNEVVFPYLRWFCWSLYFYLPVTGLSLKSYRLAILPFSFIVLGGFHKEVFALVTGWFPKVYGLKVQREQVK